VGLTGPLGDAAPVALCAQLWVKVMPLGAKMASSTAAIIGLERNASDGIIVATMASSAACS
jgi:hypothetical protein